MIGNQLRQARRQRGLSQQEAARRLGVSQSGLSLLEMGYRRVPPALLRKLRQLYDLPPTVFPLRPVEEWGRLKQDELSQALGALDYVGFAHVRRRRPWNPAELLLRALAEPDLDSRLAEALPWVAFTYTDMDWEWILRNAKLLDLQNRLGFVVTLARQLAEQRSTYPKASRLRELEAGLERARLAREDTFCHESLSSAERRWLREHRSLEAQCWNLLTDLRVEHLAYAA